MKLVYRGLGCRCGLVVGCLCWMVVLACAFWLTLLVSGLDVWGLLRRSVVRGVAFVCVLCR